MALISINHKSSFNNSNEIVFNNTPIFSKDGGSTDVIKVTSNQAVFSGSSDEGIVRITQTGNGNALIVEDEINPDSTPFVVDVNGNVGIGSALPTEKLQVVGNITASGDVTSTSDARLKTNIEPLTGALDIVNKLEGKRFNKFNKPGIGFIAQELEQYMPELVHTANDEVGTKSVNYANMVALLVEAIKEQQVTINKLESKLNGN